MPDAAPADQFWLLTGEVPSGPFSVAQIHAKLSAQEVTWETQACRVGAGTWRPLLRTPGSGPAASVTDDNLGAAKSSEVKAEPGQTAPPPLTHTPFTPFSPPVSDGGLDSAADTPPLSPSAPGRRGGNGWLVPCEKCEGDVAAEAETCPHCGSDLPRKRFNNGTTYVYCASCRTTNEYTPGSSLPENCRACGDSLQIPFQEIERELGWWNGIGLIAFVGVILGGLVGMGAGGCGVGVTGGLVGGMLGGWAGMIRYRILRACCGSTHIL